MDQDELKILKELSESFGPPGFERETASIVKKYVKDFADEILIDKLGSVMFKIKGNAKPVILIPGHIDEIGFVVSGIHKSGFLTFNTLGGWFDQVLLAQRVTVRTMRKGDRLGVITSVPPHVLTPEERKVLVTKDKMFIDVGCTSKEEVEKDGIRIGDPVVPVSAFHVMANGKSYMSKAFDDRIGVALAIDVLRHFYQAPHPNVLCGVATAMEEVGTRGAKTSAEVINPDVAIVLEVSICGDVPGIEAEQSDIQLGAGPSLSLLDAYMIPNLKLRDLVVETAEELKIPLQFSTMIGGGTDGSEIHLHRVGVPTISLEVPARHIHSHASVIHRDDYDRALQLLVAVIEKLDEETVAGLAP